MGYVVIARWTACPGEEAAVRALLEQMTEPSAAEPGCRLYQPTSDPKNTAAFTLLEIYDDEAAYQTHLDSEHFKQLAVGKAIPRLCNQRARVLRDHPLTSMPPRLPVGSMLPRSCRQRSSRVMTAQPQAPSRCLDQRRCTWLRAHTLPLAGVRTRALAW